MMDQITLADVNAAIKKHLQYQNLQIAIVTKNAQALKDSMLANAPSPITYPGEKPQALLDEDKEIGTFPLALKPENIKIVPVTELFQK
jgi:zinc protease